MAEHRHTSGFLTKIGFLLLGKSPVALSVSALLFLAVLSPMRAEPLPAVECSSPLTELIYTITDAGRFDPRKSFGVLPFNLTGSLPTQLPTMSSSGSTLSCPLMSSESKWTCPWTYDTNYDPDRYPSVIPFAMCSCQGCINRAGEEAPDMQCRPVMYKQQVLRRNGCVDGFFRYDFDFEEVPVACACMQLSTQPQNRPPGLRP
ncbi:interleukin-17A-like [Patiria miniata]|uniref:Uncharacterized protein n=1 Tax=Patiria miniata TaxID=46514 RepID=A0A914A0P0_PATMI|nr:interleukin-17A-like [Patiria miniata]